MHLHDVDITYCHVTLREAPLCSYLAHGVPTQAEEVLPHGVREVGTHVLSQDLHSLRLEREREQRRREERGNMIIRTLKLTRE